MITSSLTDDVTIRIFNMADLWLSLGNSKKKYVNSFNQAILPL